MEKTGIDYLHKEVILGGEICPVCGHKSHTVLKCNMCGRIFCENCGNVKPIFEESDDLVAVCECGATTLFVE